MSAWWDPTTAAILAGVGGGGLGATAGLYGALAGTLAPRGIGRVPMLTIHVALIVTGIGLLVAGGAAVATGQPYHVYYPFLLTGLILAGVMVPLLPVIRLRYAQSEQRRLDADSIRRS